MGKHLGRITLCLLLLCTVFISAASAASIEERKTELRQKTTDTLQRLYQKRPRHKTRLKGLPAMQSSTIPALSSVSSAVHMAAAWP